MSDDVQANTFGGFMVQHIVEKGTPWDLRDHWASSDADGTEEEIDTVLGDVGIYLNHNDDAWKIAVFPSGSAEEFIIMPFHEWILREAEGFTPCDPADENEDWDEIRNLVQILRKTADALQLIADNRDTSGAERCYQRHMSEKRPPPEFPDNFDATEILEP